MDLKGGVTLKILGINGSIRKNSYNGVILEYLVAKYGDKYTMEIADIKDLPLYSEDIENEKIESVERLREDIRSSDGIIIITPEHNASIPAALKNALDWMSRVDRVFLNKPVMVMSSSVSDIGGNRAQNHLKQILTGMGFCAQIESGIETNIGRVDKKVDKIGKLIDQPTIDHLNFRMENFVKWIEKQDK